MKSMTIKGWLLATFFLSASQGFLQAQVVVGPPTFDSGSIPSTGGITYFVFSATVPDCDWIQAGPVVRSERDFSVFLAEVRADFCPFCIDCYHQETSALVLGNLPGGDYQLSTYGQPPPAGHGCSGNSPFWCRPTVVQH
jgi:hypothetical protein